MVSSERDEFSAVRCGEHASQLCAHQRDITLMQHQLKALQEVRWKFAGAMAVLSALGAIAGGLLGKMML